MTPLIISWKFQVNIFIFDWDIRVYNIWVTMFILGICYVRVGLVMIVSLVQSSILAWPNLKSGLRVMLSIVLWPFMTFYVHGWPWYYGFIWCPYMNMMGWVPYSQLGQSESNLGSQVCELCPPLVGILDWANYTFRTIVNPCINKPENLKSIGQVVYKLC